MLLGSLQAVAITPQQFIVITVDRHEYLEAAPYTKPIGLVICLCDLDHGRCIASNGALTLELLSALK